MTPALMAALRTETATVHHKIHTLPYFESLRKGLLPIDKYACHLHVLAVIWCALEHQLAVMHNAPGPALQSVLSSQWPQLKLDLDALGIQQIDAKVVECALDIVSKILLRLARNSAALFGYLYVMQGSLQGGIVLSEKILAALKSQASIHYFNQPPEKITEQWARFSDILNGSDLPDGQHRDIVLAANELFEGLYGLFVILGELSGRPAAAHITMINPEAGNHPMPTDPRIIAAAVRAGVRAWAHYPYLALRYGERGKRFAKSDSCWLATLITLPQADANRQVEWLVRLLAARGIPSVILVRHLQFLAETLNESQPEAHAQNLLLLKAAESLSALRRKHITDEEFLRLADEWQRRLGQNNLFPANSGEVLLSAYLDNLSGITIIEEVSEWYRNNICSALGAAMAFEAAREAITTTAGKQK